MSRKEEVKMNKIKTTKISPSAPSLLKRLHPNHITFTRIFLIPWVWALYFLADPWWSAGMFAILAATDWLDGWWARRTGQTSEYGARLDMGADLVFAWGTIAFLIFVGIIPLQSDSWIFWFLFLIGTRDVGVGLVGYLNREKIDNVKPFESGRWKTVLIMTALGMLLLDTVVPNIKLWAAFVLAATTFFSITSGVFYIHKLTKFKFEDK